MLPLLQTFSWQELRHHPWRNAAAVVAVMLGVALAFSVHLINASALGEFSSAVRSVNGQPDLELRSVQGRLDEALFRRAANHPQVALASPVLELGSYALDASRQAPALARGGGGPAGGGLDRAGADARAWRDGRPAGRAGAGHRVPEPGGGHGAGAWRTGPPAHPAPPLRLQSALTLRKVKVAGTVNAGGAPLAVMDIGAAQDLFGAAGQLSRIDLRL